jgi:hypothetical protein
MYGLATIRPCDGESVNSTPLLAINPDERCSRTSVLEGDLGREPDVPSAGLAAAEGNRAIEPAGVVLIWA